MTPEGAEGGVVASFIVDPTFTVVIGAIFDLVFNCALTIKGDELTERESAALSRNFEFLNNIDCIKID